MCAQQRIAQGSISVREALSHSSFAGAHIVAGMTGVDRAVTSAMVMEAADIENWGKTGIMLVTSFFALEHLSSEERAAFLDRLSEVGVSSIVFKPERLLSKAPEDVCARCEKDSIPLIELPPETSYRCILEDVMGSLLDSNLLLLNRFFEIHRLSMNMAIGQPSIHDILGELKNLLKADCTFYSQGANTCISTSPTFLDIHKLTLREIERGQFQTLHYFKASFEGVSGTQKALGVLIPSPGSTAAYLLIHADVVQIEPQDFVAIEEFSSLIQTELLKENAVEQRVFRRNNIVVHDLLRNRYSTKAATDDALKELGIGTHPFFQTLLIRFEIIDPTQSSRLSDLLQSFTHHLKHEHFNVVYFESNNRRTYIRNFSSETQSFQPKIVEEIISKMRQDESLPPFTYLAAISSSTDRYSLSEINDEVMGIYRLFDSDHSHDHILRYDDLGIYKIFLHVKNLDDLWNFVDPRLRALKKKNSSIFSTLLILAENDMNYAKTAKQLYIHYKTVNYRINRARDVYGIDIHNTDTCAQLVIARRILTLMGEDIL
ncbi:MAG: PucR family transcriptional regulator [Atopobiaceae bacterium]|jgi:purine catabolism regulator